MIAHTGVLVSNYAKAKEFYGKALAPLGYHLEMDLVEYNAGGFKQGEHTDFWIAVKDPNVPGHVAFLAENAAAVEAFYHAALEAGAKDNGAPGYRPDYWPGYYAAFIHDADGNNIEAVWYDYSKV